MTAGHFLERWSRLKRGAEPPAPADPALPAAQAATPLQAADTAAAAAGGAAADALPPIDTLTLEADFTGFLKQEVGEALRREALRKLFSDPHFNRMDGLDVYIDDYSVADPIPPDAMKRLRQFETLLADEPSPTAPRPGEPEREDPSPGEPGRDEPRPGEPEREEPQRDESERDDPHRRDPARDESPALPAAPEGAGGSR